MVIKYVISLLLFVNSASVLAAEKRNQLEELFVWKMSDELKLSASEEKKFTEIVKDLNQKKSQLNQELNSSLEKMGKDASSKQSQEELTHYRKTLQNYSRISEEEFDRLKPVLGSAKLIQYLQAKQDLTNKMKSLLLNPAASKEAKPLPQPKVIEEK